VTQRFNEINIASPRSEKQICAEIETCKSKGNNVQRGSNTHKGRTDVVRKDRAGMRAEEEEVNNAKYECLHKRTEQMKCGSIHCKAIQNRCASEQCVRTRVQSR
jgi:hypothetical protein